MKSEATGKVPGADSQKRTYPGWTFSWKELWEIHRDHKPYQRKIRELRRRSLAIPGKVQFYGQVTPHRSWWESRRWFASKPWPRGTHLWCSLRWPTGSIDLSLLSESFRELRKNKSSGVDKVTAKEYFANLDENLYFLGITFYWGKSLKGNWVIKKKTAHKRRNRFNRGTV
jgi:hypothetical protein